MTHLKITTDELLRQSGLTAAQLAELNEAKLLVPETVAGEYRAKLAAWAKKLHYLLDEGWQIAEIKLWAVGRWKTANPRQWPPIRKDWKPQDSDILAEIPRG